MQPVDKPLVWLQDRITTPPFSLAARVEAGILLRRLQRGERLGMPHARPMPSVGRRCWELRVPDDNKAWRILFRLDADAVIVVDVFQKTTSRTPHRVISECRRRLQAYDQAVKEE